jgi:hypothetical protein
VFETNRTDENRFDIWDILTLVEADSPKEAMQAAISLSKGFEDQKVLGYPNEPVLCAVRSVHTPLPPIAVSENVHHQCRLPVLVGSISEKQVQSLRSFEVIYLPYYLIHLD